MTGLRFYSTDKPSMIGAPVEPMRKEDRLYWKLFHARRKKETKR